MCCTYCTVVNFYSCLKLNGGLRKQRKFLILASANPQNFRILKSKFFRLSMPICPCKREIHHTSNFEHGQHN